jgi:hypothetical protein
MYCRNVKQQNNFVQAHIFYRSFFYCNRLQAFVGLPLRRTLVHGEICAAVVFNSWKFTYHIARPMLVF